MITCHSLRHRLTLGLSLAIAAMSFAALPTFAQTPVKPSPSASPSPTTKPSPAAPEPEPATAEPAAASIVGQCRAAKQSTTIFKDRSATSAALMLVKNNDRVTLAENSAQDGLIAISTPVKGYIQTANLKSCEKPNPTPTPVAGSCRLVTQVKGLVIRKDAGSGDVVGGVAQNDRVALATPAASKTVEGRIWVQIAKPTAGWVSESLVGQPFKNLGACP